jgi:hypothetical protein
MEPLVPLKAAKLLGEVSKATEKEDRRKGDRNPFIGSFVFHADKYCRPANRARTPLSAMLTNADASAILALAPMLAVLTKCCSLRNPCNSSYVSHADKCCRPRNPCTDQCVCHADKNRGHHNPCTCSSFFHADTCCRPRCLPLYKACIGF